MLLFLKGIIVGIGKIMPGVSGAMLAINFNIYEKLLEAVTNFFGNWKNNLKFLLIFALGFILAIVIGSRIVLYLITYYKFITLMFFIGLITGGTYNFAKRIKYNSVVLVVILLIILLFLFVGLNNFNNTYILKGNFIDNVILFIGGIIEVFSSIVPGISGSAIFIFLGIYDLILKMTGSIFDIFYVSENINLFISYGLGMMISFMVNIYLINYLIKKYRNISYAVILGLSIASILFLFVLAFRTKFKIIEFIIGIMLLVIGMLLNTILDK